MTEEQKQLVLKTLCEGLPYGLLCDRLGQPRKLLSVSIYKEYCVELDNGKYTPNEYEIDEIKPYLRPLSSMTDEEREELFSLCTFAEYSDWERIVTEVYVIEIAHRYDPTHNSDNSFKIWGVDMKPIYWLNEHHFDYLQLIEAGLALEAPEGMYK